MDKSKEKIKPFFGPRWETEWQDMPEFVQEDLLPFQAITVRFKSQDDVEVFAKLIGRNITPNTKAIWYPKQEQQSRRDKLYVDGETTGERRRRQ